MIVEGGEGPIGRRKPEGGRAEVELALLEGHEARGGEETRRCLTENLERKQNVV